MRIVSPEKLSDFVVQIIETWGRNNTYARTAGYKIEMANQTSHRSTTYPCYLPVLGEFSRSWSCWLAGCKGIR